MEFDYFRSVLIALLTFSTLLFFVLLLSKGNFKRINGFYVMSLSFVFVVVATMLTWQVGIVADELNLGGDAVGSILYLVILILSIINIVLYFIKRNRAAKSRYRR